MRITSRLALLMCLIVFAVPLVFANHSFAVHNAQICLNGVRFTGSPSTPESFNLLMWGEVYDSGLRLLFTGSHHTFENYDSFEFTVPYTEGTFAVGDQIVYGATDIPGEVTGSNGDALYGVVEDCLLSFESVAIDNRINRFDGAAPIAVYFVNGNLEIWSINSASEGTLVITLSQATLEGAGIGLLESSGSILVYKVEGGYLIRAGMSNGKTYVLSFSELSANASYSSYEE